MPTGNFLREIDINIIDHSVQFPGWHTIGDDGICTIYAYIYLHICIYAYACMVHMPLSPSYVYMHMHYIGICIEIEIEIEIEIITSPGIPSGGVCMTP